MLGRRRTVVRRSSRGSAKELFEAQLAIAESDRPELRPVQRSFDMGPLIQTFLKVYTSDAPLQELRAEIGAFALNADAMSEEEWLPTFGRESNFAAWPERPFICTAIDTVDGALVSWTKDSGVPLGLAVASSCAVPGIVAPVTIGRRRWTAASIDDERATGEGPDKVLVVPVIAPRAAGRRGHRSAIAGAEDELQSAAGAPWAIAGR
jgi:NTE family protein